MTYLYLCETCSLFLSYFFFFFNDTATTEIYTLSLHDALPICAAGPLLRRQHHRHRRPAVAPPLLSTHLRPRLDRKSTRLNSSHANISYAVFCLKKKKKHRSTLHIMSQYTHTNRIV